MKAIHRFSLAIASSVFVAGAFFTLQLVTHSAPVEKPFDVRGSSFAISRTANERPTMAESATVAASSDAWDAQDVAEAGDEQDDRADGAGGYLDLYGNEVTDAIATYTFDKSGSLYELHSPQTELPRLGIPKS